MEKRLIIALVLSGLVLAVFGVLGPKYNKKPVVRQDKQESVKPEEATIQPSNYLDLSGKEVTVETDVLKIVYSEKGGWIKNIFLKEYKDKEGKELDLINGEGTGGLWFNSKELNQEDFTILCNDTVGGNKEVKLNFLYPNGLEIKKNFVFIPHEYNFKFSLEFINHSNEELKLDSLYLQWGPGINAEEETKQERELYNVLNINQGKELKRIKWAKLKDPLNVKDEIKWFGLNSKYFLVAFIPSEKESNLLIRKTADKGIETGLNVSAPSIAPNGKKEFSANIFAGPKKYNLLKKQGNGLEKNIDFGFFSYLSIGLLYILNGINKFARNYGIAIFILTLAVKIVLGPLTKKGFVSMQKMQKIQPEVEKLQKKYKDSPKELNTEIMQLYKERKVNPFGGCLPMVLQIPIFWALFNTLRSTIELRQAKFFWWINDLSRPDTIFNIPFHLPVMGNNINLLPVIMVATQIIQQNMMPSGAKSSEQKMMFYAMPVIFMVMFYNFPSGLVLYWTLNNLFTIIQQYFLIKDLNTSN
ncbi:MAG: membrane protein insertase YidC [bacterium]|nr:membrane protein insertase YidC [bacterium]